MNEDAIALSKLYNQLDEYHFDYLEFPDSVKSYLGQNVVLHVNDVWVDELHLLNVAQENYRIPFKNKYTDHPVLEYAIRQAIIDAIVKRSASYPMLIAKAFLKLEFPDELYTKVEADFTECLSNILVNLLIQHQESNEVQLMVRFFVMNSLADDVWGFHQSIANELSNITYSSKNKYLRVTMMDRVYGPFLKDEINAIYQRMEVCGLSSVEHAYLLLTIVYGLRPVQIRLLCEDDFIFDVSASEYYLNVPKVKSRYAKHKRTVFDRRGPLTEELTRSIEKLIQHNSDRYIPPSFNRPLFSSLKPDQDIVASDLKAYAYHLKRRATQAIMKTIEEKMALISRSTGEVLNLTAYRFRYTLATSMIINGHSKQDVALMLGHEDESSLHFYFHNTHEISEYLDSTIGASPAHVSLISAWAGAEDISSADANVIHGNDLIGLGLCGNTETCEYIPAVSCYSCPQFQPFKGGNHKQAQISIESMLLDYRSKSSGDIASQLQLALNGAVAIVNQQSIDHDQ